MALPRLSSGSPMALTKSAQEAWVRSVDNDDEKRATIETLTGKAWSAMTFGEKVLTVGTIQEAALGDVFMVRAFRARRELDRLADEVRGDIGLADKLATAEAQIALLREQKAAAEAEAARQRALLVDDAAQDAMAVYADQPAPPKRTRKARTVAA